MTATHGNAAEHHASAVSHHGQAMQYHREAARHYQVGKDYAHAAHQALVAHGHTMQAMEHGQKASEEYAEHGGRPLSKYLDRASLTDAAVGVKSLSGAEHHARAADHAEQAGRHHAVAVNHLEKNDYARASKEGQIAHQHAQHAQFHGNEAAKCHVHEDDRATIPAEPV